MSFYFFIAFNVSPYFFLPEVIVGRQHFFLRGKMTSFPVVPVPEIAVNEYYQFVFFDCDVGFAE
jgi:hypothetical protein